MPETKSEVTMCLHNWARTEWTHTIIDELSKQSCKPRVFVWNNNPDVDFKDNRADLVIQSSVNMHVRTLPAMWQMAGTPYVARMDDDLHFRDGDTELVADALARIKLCQAASKMLGPYGVRLFSDSNYEGAHHVAIPKGHGQFTDDRKKVRAKDQDIAVDLLKGRFLMANQMATLGLRCHCPHYHVDLYVGMEMAQRRRFWHICPGLFYDRAKQEGRLVDFPVDGKGYCDMGNHAAMRNKLCDEWAASCPKDRRVKKKPGPKTIKPAGGVADAANPPR